MQKHTHCFVDSYTGLVGFGADRKTDEHTVRYYLQKFSDDTLMETILPRLTDDELSGIMSLISGMLKHHMNELEYHSVFLKDSSIENGD